MPPTTNEPLPTDLPCMRCHYNLRTLSPNSLCPECATPVSRSVLFLQQGQRHFHLLIRGALLLAAAIVFSLISDMLIRYARGWLTFDSLIVISYILEILSAAAILFATILLIRSRPSLLRWPGIVAIILAGLFCALQTAVDVYFVGLRMRLWYTSLSFIWMMHLGALSFVLQLALLVAGMRFTRRFARQFQRPILSIAALVCFGAAAIEPVLWLLDYACSNLRRIGLMKIDTSPMLALVVPESLHTFLRIGAPLALTVYWIAFALIATRLAHRQNPQPL